MRSEGMGTQEGCRNEPVRDAQVVEMLLGVVLYRCFSCAFPPFFAIIFPNMTYR